ncbi:hypothetical protein [Flavivirga jejuensis]|uniref:Uncharacterized protein n=1 Tax=Flavivirga jejuensis TaxID=870487 RepID=A0ABT8WSF9_9FLAO|nr:hypothetical protein [Flavivirga jejuensis]MDO5976126.1 hypothetical protein [Flavivirga jejuensis]
MPANKKYLTKSNWTRASKIIAVTLIAPVASINFHLALAFFIGFAYVVPTSLFSIFILWGFFMVLVYWIKKVWVSWLILLVIILFSVLYIYYAKS